MKMPEPMMPLMTIIVASNNVRRRANPGLDPVLIGGGVYSIRPLPPNRYNPFVRRSRARLLLLLLGLVLLVVVSALLYMWGMAALEGKPRGFWDSLEWASETLSTTGYGADSHWNHPLMVLLVILVQFVGVFLVFLIFPIFLIPFLEERFETRLPQRA